MFTTDEHKTIVSLLAAGQPVWYVAAVTKAYAHDVYTVGVSYGYPDRTRLRQAVAHLTGFVQDAALASAP
jgi:predicted GNAT superfamily acetyltransferase